MKIEENLPFYHFSERHEIMIKSTPEKAYEALQQVDFTNSMLICLLFRLRGLKNANFPHFHGHFCTLANETSAEIVLGLIGRPWQLKGGIIHLSKEEFRKFNQPGYAKMAWNFAFERVGDATLVTTETRILCTDKASKTKFRIYWFFIRPFSGIVRREMLRLLRDHTESI